MSFGINIGKAGITGAILQKLREENISVKKLDISVWQEIMDAIKDDENFKQVYSGSTDLRDKNAFFVAKATTVQISEALWNKVLNIVCRHNGTLQVQPAAAQSHQTSGSNGAEYNPVLLSRINLASEYPELPLTSNGDVDFEALTPDKLKDRFPESDYTIQTSSENEEYVLVANKKDGKSVFSYDKILTKFGDEIRTINIEYNGVPTSLTYVNGKFSQRTTFKNNGEGYHINTQERFDENGELISKDIWNEDNTGFVTQIFSKGILCSEIFYVKNDDSIQMTDEKKVLSEKLTEEINKRIQACEDGIGFLPKTDEIDNLILNGVSKNTVSSLLYDYREATGRELLQDIIDDKMELGCDQRKELLTHITSTLRESPSAQHDTEHYFEGQSLGYELQYAMKYRDRKMFLETLDKVNKDNIEFVLDKIFNIRKNDDFYDFSDELYSQLIHMLGDSAEVYISKLTSAMIQHINESGGYTKDIVEDLNSHSDDYNKTAIDFTRLANRCHAGQSSTVTGKADGKIDINNIQQKGTGDCWLVAAVLSATNKSQKGLDYINNMLSVDSDGNVTVEFKGVNKKYIITSEEIEKSNHLASGDPDMRAIEIALDRYMKECAYESADNGGTDFSHADINGDNVALAYKAIFGNGYFNEQPDIMNDDYNADNYAFSLSFGNNPDIKATILGNSPEENQEVDLIGRHAYAIVRSDDDYIYLINPHHSSEILQVKRELLQTKRPIVYMTVICHELIE